MVGVFYQAASPEAEPYVTVGKTVKKGDTVCIIEAMKLMNVKKKMASIGLNLNGTVNGTQKNLVTIYV